MKLINSEITFKHDGKLGIIKENREKIFVKWDGKIAKFGKWEQNLESDFNEVIDDVFLNEIYEKFEIMIPSDVDVIWANDFNKVWDK